MDLQTLNSIKYYVLIRWIIWLLEFVQCLFVDKEQILSQTNFCPSLGYLKLTERVILYHVQSRK